jgi:hypothetical protein
LSKSKSLTRDVRSSSILQPAVEDDVPPSAVDWVLEHVKDRIKSMTSHLASPEKIGDSSMRGFEEAITRAALRRNGTWKLPSRL